jgi:hypothetical protein
MKKYTGKYILSWLDKDDKPGSKVYEDYSTAIKARKWLIDNGATEIDIAVEFKKG